MKQAVLFLDPRGTAWEVVRSAQARGLAPIALLSDPGILKNVAAAYREAVPAIAEWHPVTGWTDLPGILTLVDNLRRRFELVGVYFSSDPCAVPAAHLREKLGLPTTSSSALQAVTDKLVLRRTLGEAGLSALRCLPAEEVLRGGQWPFAGAAYFKPRHGVFSAFVERCRSVADVVAARAALEKGIAETPAWLREYLGRDGAACHVEEAIDGELLSVEAIVSRGRFRVLGLLSRILYSRNAVVEMGSVFPYPHPASENIVQVVRDAHARLGITEGPTHTEVIVSPDGRVEIIDLNPRFVGADVMQSINFASGTRIQETLLDWALGREITVELPRQAFSCLQYVLPPAAMTIESLALPDAPEVKFTATFVEPGQQVTHADRQIDYLGCYLTVMPTFESALGRSRELREAVVLNGRLRGAF